MGLDLMSEYRFRHRVAPKNAPLGGIPDALFIFTKGKVSDTLYDSCNPAEWFWDYLGMFIEFH